jgi:tRNA G10  N-methylase Trm11
MKHETFITLPWKLERKPPRFETDDIKYPESLVRYFLKKYTKPGDNILDPFAGLGTTLFVAEEMKRIPYGVECDERRHEWVAGQLEHWNNLIRGDSGKLLSYGFPPMDFAMTSPPYMPNHHKWNPLFGGDPRHAGYDTYLRRVTHIFRQLSKLLKPQGIVIVQADNLPGRRYTPLVRDIGNAVSKVMRPEGETIVAWSNRREPQPRHTHCLIFRNV